MMNYLIHRKALDGSPTDGFKDINSKAFPLFKAQQLLSLKQITTVPKKSMLCR
jgi:hypothetical protein